MSDQDVVKEDQVTEAVEATEIVADDVPANEESPTVEAENKENESTASVEDDAENGTIFNLQPRQHLAGKIKNITQFGAFVDMGLPQDGLVHISELSRKKVEKVEDVVAVGQDVDVWVKKVDRKRGRISLTMVKPIQRRLRDISEDDEIEGVVTRLESYGAFIDIDSERDGLVHISQITHDFIKHPQESLSVGETVQVKVIKVNRKKRQVDLSIKALVEPPVAEPVVVEKIAEKITEDAAEDDPIPTAMAVAFASLQGDAGSLSGTKRGYGKNRRKRKREQDDIVARTLASSTE